MPEFSELQAVLEQAFTTDRTLDDVLVEACRITVAAIEACTDAGISLTHRHGKVTTLAANDTRAEKLHELQNHLGDGPCLHAMWEQHAIHVNDLTTDTRWPRFADAATESGVRSMLCVQMFTRHDTLGALNLFADHPHAFDQRDQEIGLMIATSAAIAYAGAEKETELSAAITNRQRIGEAVGILAERHNITTTRAFDLLVRSSQNHNTRLRDIASRLVETEDQNRPTPGPRGTND
jgi:GAF domain-containing protein